MEINKKELRKVSRKFRTLGSNVINAHHREQNQSLSELINYINNTPILIDYIDSLSYQVDNLKDLVQEINSSYGRQGIDLGDDTEKRIYLLYKMFQYIVELNLPTTNFGAFYSGYNKYQDMSKAFGDRLVYPFISGIESYLLDISTDMGFDDSSLYNIAINSSGVQVNIAQSNSKIEAVQKNNWKLGELDQALDKAENIINNLDDSENKQILKEQVKILKSEVAEEKPRRSILQSSLNTMKFIITSVSAVPQLKEGLETIASLIGLSF